MHQRTGLRGEPLGIHPSYCINSYAQPHPGPKWSYHVFWWLLGRQTQLTTKNQKPKIKIKNKTNHTAPKNETKKLISHRFRGSCSTKGDGGAGFTISDGLSAY